MNVHALHMLAMYASTASYVHICIHALYIACMHYELTNNIEGDLFSCSPIVILSYTDVISFARNVSSELQDTLITDFWTR